MEILAAILMIASVVLPIVALVGILYFAGMLAYSWVVDLKGRPAATVPETASARAATATEPVTTP